MKSEDINNQCAFMRLKKHFILNQTVSLRQIRRVVIPEKITLNMNGLAPKPKIPPYLHRPLKSRTFSPSSPIRTPLIDNEIVLMNTLYQERFPKVDNTGL